MEYDLAIIGGGPAGVAAGVYASRKKLKTIFITEEFGGQSSVSAEIQNWIGTVSIPGIAFAKKLKEHLEVYKSDVVEIIEGDRVTKLEKAGESRFKLTTKNGATYETGAVLIASGAHRRKLEVPGAKEFDQKGLTYCASCDGPLFTDQDVVVIGGGNAGFETAAQLLAYTKSVTLLHRSAEFSKADPITVEKVLAHPKMKALKSTEPTEVKGDKFVTGVVYKNTATGETGELAVTGVFVEIGLVPNTDFAEGLVALDEYKRIVVDPKNQKTSVPGVWAAGDCTNELYHQNNIGAGDAVKALEDIYVHLKAR
ncbi:MAG TPA: FAD-dependent oxidoreductase [Candidatus Paceibacterota bacterium]|jgi:alkyl hydroperoxide reductase subunit F